MVKPDGVQRGLVGEIISRFENKGFKLTGLRLFQCSRDSAEEHYKDLKSKSFHKLVEYITLGPVVCMYVIVEKSMNILRKMNLMHVRHGRVLMASARKLTGFTNPLQAEPGTMRDLAVQTGLLAIHNLVHHKCIVRSYLR